ncbi:MAG: DivIVA domain-containing protein [Propionibacteriaceae bacterium]|jgi:cell division septum initiation protein DivIVA|nr:DivIVA domain-containing protein [Propionibacteriaceae bacterium]
MPNFQMIRRGYDPEEVNAEFERLTQELEAARSGSGGGDSELHATIDQLQQELDEMSLYTADLEDRVAQSPKAPSFDDLGSRISQMLGLAQAESEDVRSSAKREADQLTAETQSAAEQTRTEAEAYAAEVRSQADTEATRIIGQAQREAEEILDQADREALARREEAEAIYENQRARAAVAAADFEKTLAERRDEAAKDFATQMKAQDEAMQRSEESLFAIQEEAERYKAEAQEQADTTIRDANNEASDILKQAKAAAERVRRESEREVQAASARRDAITLQLSNVRQMLATMGVNPGYDADEFLEDIEEELGEGDDWQ